MGEENCRICRATKLMKLVGDVFGFDRKTNHKDTSYFL